MGRPVINRKFTTMPRIPVSGMPGHLKRAFMSGLVILRIKTAKDTKTKAAKVPMLVSSATVRIGMKAAIKADEIPVINVDM